MSRDLQHLVPARFPSAPRSAILFVLPLSPLFDPNMRNLVRLPCGLVPRSHSRMRSSRRGKGVLARKASSNVSWQRHESAAHYAGLANVDEGEREHQGHGAARAHRQDAATRLYERVVKRRRRYDDISRGYCFTRLVLYIFFQDCEEKIVKMDVMGSRNASSTRRLQRREFRPSLQGAMATMGTRPCLLESVCRELSDLVGWEWLRVKSSYLIRALHSPPYLTCAACFVHFFSFTDSSF